MPKCPVCRNEVVIIDTHFHCGRFVLLREVEDHYLSFKTLPEMLPENGCPICGKPMVGVGKFEWLFSGRKEGLDRMYCNQPDHYCYVTKTWYIENKR